MSATLLKRQQKAASAAKKTIEHFQANVETTKYAQSIKTEGDYQLPEEFKKKSAQ
jgi:hypothetical protein